jgi:hypothetical protein
MIPPEASPPSAQQAFRSYRRFVDRVLGENPSNTPEARAVYEVLFRGLIGAYEGARNGDERKALLAVRWLSGDDLDRNEASQLALRGSEDADRMVSLPGAPGAESVLLALAELAWDNQQYADAAANWQQALTINQELDPEGTRTATTITGWPGQMNASGSTRRWSPPGSRQPPFAKS